MTYGIVPPTYGQGSSRGGGGSARGGIWTPALSNVMVNGAANANGTLTILSAIYVGDDNAANFQVYYYYTPPSGVNLSSLEFVMTFPFNAADFYGYTSVYYNEHNSSRDYIAGETGGGGIFASGDETEAPYTKCLISMYMDNENTHNQYPILGLAEGAIIPYSEK